MTALNVFLQEDAAYLLTDCARYDNDGAIVDIASKVVRAPTLRIAIAWTGRASNAGIISRMKPATDQAEALQQLPGIAADIRAENLKGRPHDGSFNELMLVAVLWSDRLDRAEAWIVSTARAWLGDDYQPGSLIEIECMTMPFVDLEQLFQCRLDTSCSRSFDPVVHGVRVMDAQRNLPLEPGCAAPSIGGRAELTKITRDDLTRRILHDWGDRTLAQSQR